MGTNRNYTSLDREIGRDFEEKMREYGGSASHPAAGSQTLATPTTMFHALDELLDMNRNLVARCEALADRLTGSVPMPGESNTGPHAPSGVFDLCRADICTAQSRISDAMAALSRIERALP